MVPQRRKSRGDAKKLRVRHSNGLKLLIGRQSGSPTKLRVARRCLGRKRVREGGRGKGVKKRALVCTKFSKRRDN